MTRVEAFSICRLGQGKRAEGVGTGTLIYLQTPIQALGFTSFPKRFLQLSALGCCNVLGAREGGKSEHLSTLNGKHHWAR